MKLPEPGFGPLLELLKRGAIDGIFVAMDSRRQLLKHPLAPMIDAQLLPAPGGELFFRRNCFAAYGYETEEDFVADCREGRLKAVTVAGAISLGPTRKVESEGLELVLFGTALSCWPRFVAETKAEADQMEAFLLQAYPHGTVKRILRGKFVPFPWTDTNFIVKAIPFLISKGPQELRFLFGGMLLCLALMMVLGFLNTFYSDYDTWIWICVTVFFVLQIALVRKLRKYGALLIPSSGQTKKAEETPAT